MAMLNSSDETNVTESEGPDGSDCSPHGKTLLSSNEASKVMNTASSIHEPKAASQQPTGATSPNPAELSLSTVPLPPPETGAYDKQPGHTRSSLQKLTIAPSPHDRSTETNTAPFATNNNGNKKSAPSSGSSPTATDSDWGNTPPSTVPPSRNPSQPPSRAPSMSSGAIGGKPVTAGVSQKNGNATLARDTSTASSSTVTPNHNNSQANRTQSSKAPSVHSESGASHKFNLKDLLNTGPKLPRRSSQRSTASRSSRRSDSDGGSDGGKAGGKTKSTAGESTTSLSKKYGVCQKVAIGKGATSVVRLAHKWDRSEEKLYAVKEFRKRRKNESEKEYVKKLTAEFCISSTLHHINVVETVDLVQDESLHWCEVMEFCPGGDLYAAIKKGGMSPSEVECCFKQILSGVEYLHSQGVAHRDIKPENLFFDAKGHLKIGDYGASTVYRLPWEATVHMSTGLCGSEPYIAPEQFLGKPYDARLVDIWACGIVYYCLHFQELPWRAAQPSQDSLYAAYATACANPSPAVSACPPTINNLSPRACRSIIRRMLEPDPRHRATIEEVIAHPWVKSIEVCYEVKEPKHVHVSARAMAAHLIPVS